MNKTEAKLLLYAQRKLKREFVTPVMQTIAHSVDGGAAWLLTAGAVCLAEQTRKAGRGLLLTIGLDGLLVNGILKNGIKRERPYEYEDRLIVLCRKPKDPSFPSGHTAVSFASAVFLYAAGYKKSGVAAIGYAGLVGLSRIYLGVHYPSDVVAGAIVGSIIGLAGKELFFRA